MTSGSTSWPVGAIGRTGSATCGPIHMSACGSVGGRWTGGRVIEGEEREPLARRLLAAKYQGWSDGRPLSRWAAGSLPVEIVVDDRAGIGR